MAVEVVTVVRAVELPLATCPFLETLKATGDPSRNESSWATRLRSRRCCRMQCEHRRDCSHQNGHSKDYEEGAPNPGAWTTNSAGPVLISTTT